MPRPFLCAVDFAVTPPLASEGPRQAKDDGVATATALIARPSGRLNLVRRRAHRRGGLCERAAAPRIIAKDEITRKADLISASMRYDG